MSDGFDNLADALASFGISLTERTRLTFGAPVLKSLSTLPATGKVFVACQGGEGILKLESALSETARKSAAFVNALDTEYGKVRPHVANYAKSRKVLVNVNAIRDADENPIGFTVSKRTK